MDSDDIVWLTANDVIQIHEAIFYPARAPGERSDRPVDGLISNVPNHFNYSGYELDVVLIASAYAHDIVRAHAFHDGNKRTAPAFFRQQSRRK
ncbi:MAG: Fic family protein [Granulosicoccaceae bacterium]